MSLSAGWYPVIAIQVVDSLYEKMQPQIAQLVVGKDALEGIDLVFIQVAFGLAPEPLTPETFIKRAPYARPEAFIENMLASTERGWFIQENGKFWLTEAGNEVVKELIEHNNGLFSSIETLPAAELERLFKLLNLVVEKIKQLPCPVEKPAFELSLRFDRGVSVPLLSQIRRRMIDLLAFRDDVHIAAWTPHETEGQIWETFTFLWRKQAQNAADLAEQLVARNYDQVAYAAALEKLVRRGWLIQRGDIYFIQPKAAQLRQEVEDLTDQLYNAAFADLSPAEMAEFQSLMTKLAQTIQLPPEQQSKRKPSANPGR